MKNVIRQWLSLAIIIATLLTFTACGGDATLNGSSTTSALSSSVTSLEPDTSDASSSTSDEAHLSGSGNNFAFTVPAYSGAPYAVVNDNQPNFSEAELTTKAYEKYTPLDQYGRCGVAIASCGTEIMPAADEKRGSISSVKPSGWVQASYSGISGGYLWNRCHLIGWQLSAENANTSNLITGTRYMNIEGMLPFENMVADYIRETKNHVAYRITPIFAENELVCRGVRMEAFSIEDNGEGICFHVYCYNVQPGITIDYATGKSSSGTSVSSNPSSVQSAYTATPSVTITPVESLVWIPKTGTKYHSSPSCSNMKNPSQVTEQTAKNRGYTPCSKCY